MKLLLMGSSGYVGGLIKKHFEAVYETICLDLMPQKESDIRCDLSNADATARIAKKFAPDVVIHAVGSKDIKYCEENPVKARRINCSTIKNAAAFFSSKRIIYISTDYVFAGDRGMYDEQDAPAPQTVYGKSKLCGETAGSEIAGGNFSILRLSALYDSGSAFVSFLNERLSKNQPVECYDNVRYSPTYFKDFLCILEKLILRGGGRKAKIFHACGEAQSRYDFARKYASIFDFDERLIKRSSYERNENIFLFPNLSMKNEITRKELGVETTKTEDALLDIRQEGAGKNENI